MLHNRRQRSALRRSAPANRNARLAGRIQGRIGWYTNRRNRFAKLDRLAQPHQRNVMVVRVRIEVPMPDDGADGSHYRRRLGGDELIVVAENDADLGAAQSVRDQRRNISVSETH